MAYGSSNPGPPGPSGSDMFSDGDMPEKKEGMEHEEGGEATGLLPKSLMAGKDFKPGDEIVLKVVHVGENDFEVEYAKEKGGEKDEGYEGDKMMAEKTGGSSDMAAMME